MLKAHLLRRALQMHIRPSALVELVRAVQARVGRCGGGRGKRGHKRGGNKQSREAHKLNSSGV